LIILFVTYSPGQVCEAQFSKSENKVYRQVEGKEKRDEDNRSQDVQVIKRLKAVLSSGADVIGAGEPVVVEEQDYSLHRSPVLFPKDSTTIDLHWIAAKLDDTSVIQDIERLLFRRFCTYKVDTQDLVSGQIVQKTLGWAVYPSIGRENQKAFPVELIVNTKQPVTPVNNEATQVKNVLDERQLHWIANEQRAPSHFGYFELTTQETVNAIEIRRECVPLGGGRAQIRIIVQAQIPLLIRVWGLKRKVNIEPESISPQDFRLSDNGVLFFDYGKDPEELRSEREYSFVISGLSEGHLFYPMTNALDHVQMRSRGCPISPMRQVQGSIWGFAFTLKSERAFRIFDVEKWVNELYQLEELNIKQKTKVPIEATAEINVTAKNTVVPQDRDCEADVNIHVTESVPTQLVEKTFSEEQVEIRANTEKRHRLDEYPYHEEYRDGAAHVLGTIHGDVVWSNEKSPYVMDENVLVAKDGTLTIEPGVVVKVVRLTESTSSINAYVGLIIRGRLMAEGKPDEMIHFTSAAEEPVKYREWQGIVFGINCSPSILKWTLVEDAIFGVDTYGPLFIAHCVFRECHTGIYLERDFAGDVVHNISAYNLYSGIRCKETRAEATIINNIFYENGDGIQGWGGAVAYADYNLYWSSRNRRYYSGMKPGEHDILVDPGLIDINKDDFSMLETSTTNNAGFKNADIGLYIRDWSEKSAREENQNWFSNGGRSLWYEGLASSRDQGKLRTAQKGYELALEKELPPELKDKICCSLGHVLTLQKSYWLAKLTLEKVLSDSEYPHLRDLARRYLAEVLAEEGHPQEALLILEDLEWPQSQVWAKFTKAKYIATAGDYKETLRTLESMKDREPGRYVKAVSEITSTCLEANQINAAVATLEGFAAYPIAKEVAGAYLSIAKAARSQGHFKLAVELLKKSIETDPFSKEAPESLFLLAEILDSDLDRFDEANAVRFRLCRNYFPYNSYVMETRRKLANNQNVQITDTQERFSEQDRLYDRKILLDGSLGESSIFDRCPEGSYNFGQYEVIRILTEAGCIVHVNNYERLKGSKHGRQLTPELLSDYALIFCNGRYGGGADPPIDKDIIENLVNYVQEGGNILVVAGGRELGSGKLAQFYNPLVERFGIRFVENKSLIKSKCVVTDHPAMKGLFSFWAEAGVHVSVSRGDVLGYIDNKPVIAITRYGKGKVITAGLGSGFMGACLRDDTTRKAGVRQNNAKLLVNLVSYLLDSKH